jgi:hypothetical protein
MYMFGILFSLGMFLACISVVQSLLAVYLMCGFILSLHILSTGDVQTAQLTSLAID